ncbi:ABC transporter permease subunit [Micromonospora sp. LZ34]
MSFRHLLRAEWTKLLSVSRWLLSLAAAAVFTVAFSVLAASGGSTDRSSDVAVGPGGKPVADDFHFVHRTLTGDGSIVVRVTDQQNSHPQSMAGVMIKNGVTRGSSYVSLAVTPDGSVRMMADFRDVEKRAGAAPRWLRLTRTGAHVATYDSTDGSTWREIGAVDLRALPATAEIGMYVSSPGEIRLERSAGATSVGQRPTTGQATFADVRVDGSTGSSWKSEDLIQPGLERKGGPAPGGTTEGAGTFTLTGAGDIGVNEPPDDTVQIGLFGTLAGLLVLVPLGVVFVTSEYRRGMIRTTFAAAPARAPVLAAKAVVLAGVTFAVGLAAALVAFFVTQPILRDHGFAPPMFPTPSLTEPRVLRAVIGAAVFLTLLALLGLGAGAIMRRGAPAIATVITLTLVPMFVGTVVPVAAARTLMLITPAGGFAMQRAKPATDWLVEPWSMIGPWAGLAVLGTYAVAALVAGGWLMRRRDV